MRDLASQDFKKKSKSFTSKTILRLILIILVVGGVVYLARGRLIFNAGGGSSITLRDAPGGLTGVSVSGTGYSNKGVDLKTQKATLKDVKYGGEASGIATRSFGGGTYILSVEATLPDPKNTNYEVWLVSGEDVLPVDFMTGSKKSWSLSLRDTDKYSSYDRIMVTLERTKDNLPEERVLEGSF